MKRWQVEFDGASAGYVYADTVEAARRAAQAAYARVHAERDGARGLARVVGEGVDLESEVLEAKQVVGEVYEGLRLLPGMEMPAEKLRSVVLLLELAAARAGVRVQGPRTTEGDTELRDALAPVLEARTVPSPVQAQLQGLLEWVGVNTADADRRKVELQLFRALWEAGLVDARFADPPACKLHRASAFLARRLERGGVLRLERFEDVRDLDALRDAVQPHGKEAVSKTWGFVPPSEGAARVEVLRPLALLGDRVLQPALVMRGVPCADEEVVALDRALFDAWLRLRTWTEGLGRLAEPHLKDVQLQLVSRTDKRLTEARQQMARAAQEGGAVLPTETARRDLIKFLVDQVHRIEDALAFLPDRGLRDAFSDLVFKDVVFRSAGPYLSKKYNIAIDTAVVAGADTQALVGKFKKEQGGPKPVRETNKVFSVVVPCFLQDGVTIRPATVRVGEF